MEKRKILVVDDMAETRAMFAHLLEQEGYQTFQAEDGIEGLQKATEEQPDLILLDIMMPVMDGYQL